LWFGSGFAQPTICAITQTISYQKSDLKIIDKGLVMAAKSATVQGKKMNDPLQLMCRTNSTMKWMNLIQLTWKAMLISRVKQREKGPNSASSTERRMAKDRQRREEKKQVYFTLSVINEKDEVKKILDKGEGKTASTVNQDSSSAVKQNKNINLMGYQGVEKTSSVGKPDSTSMEKGLNSPATLTLICLVNQRSGRWLVI
jgi:hypothetical protein